MDTYICTLCNYECINNNEFIEHISTDVIGKAKMINGVMVEWTTYNCNICGKKYKHRSGLSRRCIIHKQITHNG